MHKKTPEFIFRDGKPSAVILAIDDYARLLEKIEDAEDLREIERIKKNKSRFISLEDYLKKRKT